MIIRERDLDPNIWFPYTNWRVKVTDSIEKEKIKIGKEKWEEIRKKLKEREEKEELIEQGFKASQARFLILTNIEQKKLNSILIKKLKEFEEQLIQAIKKKAKENYKKFCVGTIKSLLLKRMVKVEELSLEYHDYKKKIDDAENGRDIFNFKEEIKKNISLVSKDESISRERAKKVKNDELKEAEQEIMRQKMYEEDGMERTDFKKVGEEENNEENTVYPFKFQQLFQRFFSTKSSSKER